MAVQYGITNGRSSQLAALLGTSDATASVIGGLVGANGAFRYNCLIDAETIGFTGCNTTTWTVVERGVSGGTVVSHVAGRPVVNQLDADYLEHIAGGGAVAPIEFVIDGGGAEITTGSKGYIEVPFACTIAANRLMADQSGSIDVTIAKANYATMPTTASIVASAHPALSSALKSQDTTLTGWTTAIGAGDWLEFSVNSASVVTRVTVSLTVAKA